MSVPRVFAFLFVVAALLQGAPVDAKKKKPDDTASGDPKAAPASASPSVTKATTAAPRPLDDDTYGPQLPPDPNAVVAAPPFKFTRGEIMVGARVGTVLPQPFSSFGASFLVGVEVGWQLPKLPGIGRGLTLSVDLAYTQPEASGMPTQPDPRVVGNGGTYQWSITERQLTLGINVIYRFNMIGSGRFVPYIGVGPRFFFLQTTTGGHSDAATTFPSYSEQSTHVGVGVPLGVDVLLGPGRLFLEASLMYASFNHNVTGSTNAGAITIEAGYRIFL